MNIDTIIHLLVYSVTCFALGWRFNKDIPLLIAILGALLCFDITLNNINDNVTEIKEELLK